MPAAGSFTNQRSQRTEHGLGDVTLDAFSPRYDRTARQLEHRRSSGNPVAGGRKPTKSDGAVTGRLATIRGGAVYAPPFSPVQRGGQSKKAWGTRKADLAPGALGSAFGSSSAP